MSDIPSELKYTESHEWVRIEGDGSMTVGITDHAQSLLGDLVYVELPEEGSDFNTGDDCGVLESVKAASDLYSPIAGKVTAVNEDLNDNPALINTDPYGGGWIFKLEATDESELNELLDADSYQEHVDAE